MDCPFCESMDTVKNGHKYWKRKNGEGCRQRFLCKNCGKSFTQTTSKRGAIVILAPRRMIPNLFFELKAVLQQSPTIRLRRGEVTIKEVS